NTDADGLLAGEQRLQQLRVRGGRVEAVAGPSSPSAGAALHVLRAAVGAAVAVGQRNLAGPQGEDVNSLAGPQGCELEGFLVRHHAGTLSVRWCCSCGAAL